MKKIKNWLIDRFLPMWAKETVLSDNRNLRKKNDELEQKVLELQAYIDGLSTGMRAIRRITIHAGTKEEKRE